MAKRTTNWQRQVAAIVCGLILLNAATPLWAASKKPPRKAAMGRHLKKSARHPVHHVEPAAEFGPADLIEDVGPGLHGHASFYGKGFQGRKTATGERFDVQQFTAASNHFPLGTLLAVRRVDNDRCAIVKVNDRMHAKHRKRIIDVSHGVAEFLDMIRAGVVFVSVAPMKKGWQVRGESACHAAFEADAVVDCPTCGTDGRLPEPEAPAKLPSFMSPFGD